MKFFTNSQKNWIGNRTIHVGSFYMFPRNGFTVYSSPNYMGEAEYIDTNPFTKSLDHEFFDVKEKVNGFCRGNFHFKPKSPDFYLYEEELAYRGTGTVIFLLIVLAIPFGIRNWWNGGVEKLNKMDEEKLVTQTQK